MVVSIFIIAANTVFLILVWIAGLTGITVWMLITLYQLNFRKAHIAEGNKYNNIKEKFWGIDLVRIAFFL
ncbi:MULTISPECIES: hypothetical protein [Priestia]|uniref:hypothetical protein n=1 Tax=Priestia TaxID=2800373 RepID=UPI001E38F468|nr:MULTISPECIES: hypothetical protein [Priestia]MED3922888.1 hypothetical protein [Priestia aryabhattai]